MRDETRCGSWSRVDRTGQKFPTTRPFGVIRPAAADCRITLRSSESRWFELQSFKLQHFSLHREMVYPHLQVSTRLALLIKWCEQKCICHTVPEAWTITVNDSDPSTPWLQGHHPHCSHNTCPAYFSYDIHETGVGLRCVVWRPHEFRLSGRIDCYDSVQGEQSC